MDSYIRRYGRNSLIISALLIIFALCLIFAPAQFLNILLMVFGSIILLTGIIHVISYFVSPDISRMFNFELLEGICGMIVGFIILLNPEKIQIFLPCIMGLWVIMSGIIRFQIALNMRHIPKSDWTLLLVLSIFTTFLGIMILLNPFSITYAIVTLAGTLLLVSEILNLFEYSCVLTRLGRKNKVDKSK